MNFVRDIIQKKGPQVAAVSADQSVLSAAQLMNDRRIGSVVVTQGETVVGIFTERDILTRVVAAQKDPASVAVRDVMTHPCVVCGPEDEITQCQAMMTEKHIRHIPVVSEGKLVGIISSGDILASSKVQLEEAVRYLSEYIYG